MVNNLGKNLKIFFKEPQWEKVRGVFWFIVINLIFHILWRIWANSLHFAPIQSMISSLRTFLVHQLYNQTTYFLSQILNVTIYKEPHIIITKNGLRLLLGESAAGLKQMCQFAVLILLFKGPWKYKLWYIPLGMIVLHLTNIFRIVCLVVIAMHWPNQIHYAHDNWLRILYYVVIFGLWMFWVEKLSGSQLNQGERE
jgi:exosortase/archaeosortase family protein